MMNFRLILLGLILLTGSAVKAEPMSIHPFVKGSFAEIKQQHSDQPFIVIFWSESCAYCMKELAMFGRLQSQFPGVELVTVATDPFLQEETVKAVFDRSQLNVSRTWVFAEQFPEKIYFDVNKRWRGELPVTHFFSRDHQEIRHLGIIEEQELLEWLAKQTEL